jgi:hypothetical protein
MKQRSKSFQKKSENEISNIWRDGLITFDTNVLLDFYRYSEETRRQYFSLLRKLNDKIFITDQSILEFNRRRYDVICSQEEIYKKYCSEIDKIEKDLEAKNQPPFFR